MKERFSRLKMFCLKIETVSHCRYFCQEFFKGRPNHRYQELITRSEQKPFPSSKNSHFLNEANCKTFLMKIRFICMTMTKSFSCQPHSASLWNRGLTWLGNGLFSCIHVTLFSQTSQKRSESDFINVLNAFSFSYTVFIRISAQPRISAHPHPTPPPSHSHSNKRPLPSRYHPKKGISTYLRLPPRRSFLKSVLQKPCFVTSSRCVITIYCFLAKYTYYTCWKWWKFNKRPGWLIE